MGDTLASFHPVLKQWFQNTFGSPTPPQKEGWPHIDAGRNVLLLAPTGSGKTLAAFFKCLDILYKKLLAGEISAHSGVQVLYISPLKALNNDIHKNLQEPLNGIIKTGSQMGVEMPHITTAVRTGDTPQAERQKMRKKPPHILITTPESLYLMLSSSARDTLKTVQFVIVDEIHTLFPTKRGCHLALSLERLQNLVGDRPFQRIGLSATINPLAEVGQFLVGHGKDCTIIDSGQRKDYDLQIELPLPDLRILPEKSVWPAVYGKLYRLIQEHSTTLVFVNNRRQAERIAVHLNKLAGKEISRTHHGSISRELRLENEDLLKQGEIPCIVATSSLELGIDVGHIDLVVQIESPKEVSRGIQRIGRAGHVIGLPSKARIIPKTRLDLLESLVMLAAVKEAAIEPCQAPLNCFDILAQQLVAMTTEGCWTPQDMYSLCTRAYNYTDLKWPDFERVLKMLAGIYESDQVIDLRPRLQWDRLNNIVSVDSYGKQLVYSNSGTIPNRGYYGVYLGEGGTRLGELDEEFVYERRLGDRFLLGTTVWRIEELRQDRVIVTKASSQGPTVPFWKGEMVGRSLVFGKRLGTFIQEAEGHLTNSDQFHTWLESKLFVQNKQVSQNLYSLLENQKRSTGKLPSNACLVQEEFLDEMGDWHVCLHSPYGKKLHTLLALLMSDQIQREAGLTIEAVPADNGILFHTPGGAKPPHFNWSTLASLNLRERIAELISTTSLFGITFRNCAQRSLVMALLAYGKKRTPLWLSRLKASDLLQVVSAYTDFPLVVETYREILQDYFSIGDLENFLSEIMQGTISIHTVQTKTPSPFAHEHLFNFVGTQMYGDGTPASNRKKLFGVETATLQELFDEGFQPQLRDDATFTVETRLQGRDALLYKPTLERTQYWLERVGDITRTELEEYFPENAQQVVDFLEQLLAQGKAFETPDGLLAASLYYDEYNARSESLHSILSRYSKCHGPFSEQTVTQRYGVKHKEVSKILLQLKEDKLIESGDFGWYNPRILKEIHTLSLRQERNEVLTADFNQFTEFLAQWQNVQLKSSRTEQDADQEQHVNLQYRVLQQLQELWLPVQKLETQILPARILHYSGSHLDQLLGSGLLSWRARQGGKEIFVRFESSLTSDSFSIPTWVTCPVYTEDFLASIALSPGAKELLKILQKQGALNLIQLSKALEQSVSRLWEDLTELILSGLVGNDTFGPVRFLIQNTKHQARQLRSLIDASIMGTMGRFFLLPQKREISAATYVQILLDRYGIVTKDMAIAEKHTWGDLYPILDYLETMGEVKRGYFVDGLHGIQFASEEAVTKLNQTPTHSEQWWVLTKQDPALSDQFSTDQIKAGSTTVFKSGIPVISAEKRKLSVSIHAPLTDEEVEQGLLLMLQSLYPLYYNEKIVISEINGVPATTCSVFSILKQLGFEAGYEEAILWPSKRR